MRNIFVVLFYFTCFTIFAQNTLHALNDKKVSGFSSIKNIKIEDQNGRLITDSIERKTYFEKKQQNIDFDTKISNRLSLAQTAVQMCSNSGFEEYETVSGVNVLKDFMFTEGFVQNPIQCKSVTETANQNISQYDPNNSSLMVSTIPSNFLDEYIGNINAFDQYSLKVNYKSSNYNMGMVQAKRFKTNNETTLKFNYKAILQSITDSSHNNEQPYFKARVLNKNGVVVSEFCLIGDPTNCIFTQASNLEGGSIV